MPDKNLKKIIISLIKWILIALILYFIYRQISAQWEQVRDYDWTINWVYFISSIIILQIGLFYKSFLWSRVLACFGTYLPPMRAFKVAYLSNLGRYVPGKIVQFKRNSECTKSTRKKSRIACRSTSKPRLATTVRSLSGG